ncbi:MAG: response regulator, partial [Elusimicrobia bacterium]|nr:response regulator [Elusimicrobiota bacterium]
MSHEILLVDDESVFSDLTRDQLAHRGFSVTVAYSGEEALNRIKDHPPDIILLDVMMTGISGIEVLQHLQSDPQLKDIPVVVCSITMQEKTAIRRLLEMGARGFIAKPCRPDDLAAKIRDVLG